jgi:hypothetical protein
LANGMDMVAGKTAGTYDFKHKSELKSSINDECEGKLTATNKDYALELEYNPADLNKDGLHSSLEVEAKCTPVKGDWEGKVEFKVGGYELGPIKSWTELQFETNKAQNHVLTHSQNFNMDDFHVAYKCVGDLGTKSLSEAYGILAVKNSLGDFWFRSNCLSKVLGLGTT